MNRSATPRKVIPATSVRHSDQPAFIESNHAVGGGTRAMSVVPLIDQGAVVGIEVRCSCGSSVVIECVYDRHAGDNGELGGVE